MKRNSKNKRILIVDRESYWRSFSANSLEAAGFAVHTLDSYDYAAFLDYVRDEPPDLIVFGCGKVEPEDQEMIEHMLEQGCHLLVLCTSPEWALVQTLFRAGADDVADKPYDRGRLLDLIRQTLQSIVPRNSYEAVQRQGVA